MIERPDANVLMAGPLGGWLEAQNAARTEAKAKARTRQITGIAAACAVAVVVILLGGDIALALQLGFFTGAAGFGWAEFAKRPVINRLKGGINGAIAEALGLKYSIEVTPGQSFQQARDFELVPSYDNASFQDLWWGQVGDRPFTLHEAKLTEQRGSGKNRRTVTVFEGSILLIGFNRKFLGTTLVERHGQHRTLLGLGSERDEVTIGGIPLTRADMTDPRFEDRFTVWSNDGVEARYLVHPDYIERLVKVEEAFAGQKIRALFQDGDLLIAVETGDMFESGSLESGEDRVLLERTIQQFGALADLASQLNERPRAGFN